MQQIGNSPRLIGSDGIMIIWVNMTEFAKRLGVCLTTFKLNYRDIVPPPQRKTGNRCYWTEETVQRTIEQIESGELVA